ASKFRQQAVDTLLQHVSFQAIKGNAGEIAHLANVPWDTRGVDSEDGDLEELETIANRIAKRLHTTVIITGKIDLITNGTSTQQNNSGHELLTKVTGAGCLLGSIVTACLASNSDAIQAAYEAVHFYGLAAEQAAQQANVLGPGSFMQAFIDQLQR